MPGIKMQRQKSGGNQAAIHARVSDKSQDAEVKTSIGGQTSEIEAYSTASSGADRGGTLPGGGPRLLQEAP